MSVRPGTWGGQGSTYGEAILKTGLAPLLSLRERAPNPLGYPLSMLKKPNPSTRKTG